MLAALLDPASPDRPDLVRVGDSVLSRGAVLDAAGRVAAALAARSAGGPLAVHATSSVATVAAVVGGLLAGVAVVPVPPDSGPLEREHVLRDSGAVTWSGPAELAPGLPVLTPAAAAARRSRPTPTRRRWCSTRPARPGCPRACR